MTPMELKHACVMVVDDQAVMRLLIIGSLRKLGVQRLHAFADATSALAALASTRPDLVLTDVQMRPIDGIGLVRAIRVLPDPQLAATRVVFVTGDTSDSARQVAEALGVCGFMAKPPTPAALADTLGRVLA